MVLPVFTLLTGALRCFSGLLGVVVHRQRKIFENESDRTFVFFFQPLDRRLYLLAVRALVVGVFEQGDAGIGRTSPGRLIQGQRRAGAARCISVASLRKESM